MKGPNKQLKRKKKLYLNIACEICPIFVEYHLKSEFTSPENEPPKNQHQWWKNGKKSLKNNKNG